MVEVFTGDNNYALQTALQAKTNTFIAQHGDLSVEKFDGEEASYSAILGSLQGMALFATDKLVVIRDFTAHKELLDKLETVLANIPDTTTVILVSSKLDKRTQYYKLLKKQATILEFSALDERGLTQWLVGTAKEQGGSLSSSDAGFLVARVGTNQALLAQELDKLLIYDRTITRQAIELLCESTPQSTIFELLEAAFAGNKQRAMQLYEDQRRQRVEPLAILAMIGWQLQTMSLVATGQERGPEVIAREAKLHPFVVRKTLTLVRNRPLGELKGLVRRTLDLDMKLKSTAVNTDDALQHFLLTL